MHGKKLRRGVKPDLPRRRLLLFLIAATLPLIPAALLNDWLDPLFYNTFFIGFALIVTGFLLLAADRFGHGNKTEKAMTLPAPITTLFPIVTPGRMITPPPIHTLSPMVTGAVWVLQNSKEPSSFGTPNRSAAFVG